MSVLLVSHYTDTPGMCHKINDYFLRHNSQTISILHPLYPKKGGKSTIETENTTASFTLMPKLQFMLEGIVSAYKYSLLKNKREIDVAICFDPLAFIHTFLFRSVYGYKKICYYNLDFSVTRFSNPLLNKIYHSINRFAYQKCDYFLTPSALFSKVIDPKEEFTSKQFLVPHTVQINKQKSNKRKEKSIIFAGSISKTIDFSALLQALKKVKATHPTVKLDIYGSGDTLPALKDEIKKLQLSSVVTYKGIADNKQLVTSILPSYEIGLAPYALPGTPGAPDHMFLGNDLTSKIVEYFVAGLPVISTRIYEAFDVIETDKLGYLVATAQDWTTALDSLLTNKKKIKTYQSNVESYVKKHYDEESILTPIFTAM